MKREQNKRERLASIAGIAKKEPKRLFSLAKIEVFLLLLGN